MLAALRYPELRNGEVVIKLNDEYYLGSITELDISIREAHLTEFRICGLVR